ncbi:transposase, partial [Shigella boydii]
MTFIKNMASHKTAGFAPIFPDICYHLTHYK